MIRDLYGQRRRLAAAVVWRMAALIWQSWEVWLAVLLLGHPIGVLEAIMLKSRSNTVATPPSSFLTATASRRAPSSFWAASSGLAPTSQLAVSLAIRIRELLVDVPGLIAWQAVEGRALFRRRRA